MHMIKNLTLGLLAAGWLAVAGPGTANAQTLHEACETSILHFCDTVTPGNGRIMACLYAHEDKVSGACDDVTNDVSTILDSVFAKINDVLSECTPDIEKLCSDAKFGEGRMLTCLSENSASLSEGCKAVAPQISTDLAD